MGTIIYQCLQGHKHLIHQCQTIGHDLSSYISTKTKLLTLNTVIKAVFQYQFRIVLDILFKLGLTLSLLGYLKTRICWGGGGQFDPPSKSHVLFPNMTNHTSLESSCALLLESAKKICKFEKIEFFIAKSSYIVKMFSKKIVQKIKNYTFLKSPWPCYFKYAEIFAIF